MASSYRAADSKREEFRRYLEKCGVLDALTKVLVGLYEEPEKPNNALDFLKQHLSLSAEGGEGDALRAETADLRARVESLTEENRDLKAKLAHYEAAAEEGSVEPLAR